MDANPPPHIWPTLLYDNVLEAIGFLQAAFGFEMTVMVPNNVDPTVIEHAQMRWPEGGGIMLSSSNRVGNPFSERPTGAASVYVVTRFPDGLYERAAEAGAVVFSDLRDQEYGSRGFSVTDPEGNVWSFGTYAGD